jgi:hypothetical protein
LTQRGEVTEEAWAKAKAIIQRGYEGVPLTGDDEKFLELLKLATDGERAELKSALYELKDISLARKDKSRAWQKVQVFLARVTPAVGQALVNVLERYLTHLATRLPS